MMIQNSSDLSRAGKARAAQPTQGGNREISISKNRPRRRRVALLGAGYVADWHAKALLSLAEVELVAICDRERERAKAFAERFNVPRVYFTTEEMVAAEKLDAVHVLLPPDQHFQAGKVILSNGVNVLLEKPMCVRAEDYDSLIK